MVIDLEQEVIVLWLKVKRKLFLSILNQELGLFYKISKNYDAQIFITLAQLLKKIQLEML